MAAGVLTLALFVSLDLYSIHTYMLDPDEADILSIALASLHGQPMYHSTHSLNFSYSMIYGPLMFLIYRAGLLIGGGRFWVLRALLICANLLLCFVLYSIFRKANARRDIALALMTLPLCQMLVQIKYDFGLRSDAWIVLAMALASRASLMDSDLAAALLTGFFAGLAIDLKATVALAFLLLLLMLYRRSGLKCASIATLVAAGTVLAPFALQNISLINYSMWLLVAKGEGSGVSLLMGEVLLAYAVFMVLPLLALQACGVDPWSGKPGRKALPEMLLLAFCVLGVTAVAAKPGAGTWHFWQLVPVLSLYVALAVGRSKANSERVAYAVLIITLGSTAVGLRYVGRDISALQPPSAAVRQQLGVARQEIESYLDQYSGRIVEMGYGDHRYDLVETLRYIPVLHGQPYVLDPRFEIFMQPFPQGILQKMDHCTDDVWIIPHGEPPFAMLYIFPPVLHDTFLRDYAVQRSGTVLDAWVCKNAPK